MGFESSSVAWSAEQLPQAHAKLDFARTAQDDLIVAATRDCVTGIVELKNAFTMINRDHVVTGCTVASDFLGRVAYEWLQSDSQHVFSATIERNSFGSRMLHALRLVPKFVQSEMRCRSGVLVGLSPHSWHIHAGNCRRCRLPGRNQLAARHGGVPVGLQRVLRGSEAGSPRCRAGATRGATVLHTNQDRSSDIEVTSGSCQSLTWRGWLKSNNSWTDSVATSTTSSLHAAGTHALVRTTSQAARTPVPQTLAFPQERCQQVRGHAPPTIAQ